VLLRSNKRLHLAVGPLQVSASVSASDGSLAESAIALGAPNPAADHYGELGAALRLALKELAARNRRLPQRVDVEIDDALAFYDVVEIDARALGEPDLERLAALGMADTLGLDASMLAVRCAVQEDGRSAVACALPVALLEAITAATADAGCTIRSIEPAFAAFLNRHRRFLQQPEGMVARLRGGLLMLGLRHGGKWRAFSAERVTSGQWQTLRERGDAFCHRLCVPAIRQLPVWFDTDAEDVPQQTDPRWHRLPPALVQL
jgi:hypothetical protein